MLCVPFADDFLSPKAALVTKLLTNSSSVFLFWQSSISIDSLPRNPCCLQPVTRQIAPKKTTHIFSGNQEGRATYIHKKAACGRYYVKYPICIISFTLTSLQQWRHWGPHFTDLETGSQKDRNFLKLHII